MAIQSKVQSQPTQLGFRDWLAVAYTPLLLVAILPNTLAFIWTAKVVVTLTALGPGLLHLVWLAWRADRAAIAGIVFVSIAGLATLLSDDPLTALTGLYNLGTGWIFTAIVVGAWTLGRQMSRGTENKVEKKLIALLLAGAFVNALISWLQISPFFSSTILTDLDGRAHGLMGNPVHLAALMNAAFALTAEFLHPALTSERKRKSGKFYIVLGFSGAFVFASTIQLSGGRLGLAILPLIILASVWRRRFFISALLSLATAAGILAAGLATTSKSSSASERFSQARGSTFSGRIERWKMAGTAIEKDPLWGAGPGLYRRATSPHNTVPAALGMGPDHLHEDGHNIFIEYATTTGILGLAALLTWLIFIGRQIRGPLVAFVAGGSLSFLLQPQSLALMPALAFAAGASANLPRYPLAKKIALSSLVLSFLGLALGLSVAFTDHLLSRAVLQNDVMAAKRAVAFMPIWAELPTSEVKALRAQPDIEKSSLLQREVLAACREAVRRDPSSPKANNDLGAMEILYGTRPVAIRAFDAALHWDPYSLRALLARASLAAETGDQTLSATLCQKVHELKKEFTCPFSLPKSTGASDRD